MKVAPAFLTALALLVGCDASRPGYVSSFDFARVQPTLGVVSGLVQGPAALDAAGLYVRKSVDFTWTPSPDGKLEDLLQALVGAFTNDLEKAGFQTKAVNNEPTVRFVKYKTQGCEGTVYMQARKTGDSYTLEVRIGEDP